MKFIGRRQEFKILEEFYAWKQSSLLVVKGRRRIGKSRLVNEFADNKVFYRFEGLAPDKGVTAQDQRNEFILAMRQYFTDLPYIDSKDWSAIFYELSKQVIKSRKNRSEKLVILFDEISWMAEKDRTFLAKLKKAWDNYFKGEMNVMLILCSSISLWVEKNILESTAFVGRISYVMKLSELPLNRCKEFWGQQLENTSAYDILKYLSITGGVPLYLEHIQANLPVDENIRRLCFSSGGLLFREFNNIFYDLFGKSYGKYKKIVKILAEKTSSIEDLAKKLGLVRSGDLMKSINNLIEAGFVSRDYTWSIGDDQFGKLSRLRLSDNYLRFYLRYLEKNKQKILNDQFEETSLSNLKGWSTVTGLQFENLVLNNRKLIWKYLDLNPDDIVVDGAYFQSKTKKTESCQVDYMIQTKYNNLFVCEVKFSRNLVDTKVINECKRKIERIHRPKSFSCFPVLIHVNGVTDGIIDSCYFTKILSFDEFFE
jgi:AAA+ ATPase superfamily predicted ATPase